jgi:hypothetical protein
VVERRLAGRISLGCGIERSHTDPPMPQRRETAFRTPFNARR